MEHPEMNVLVIDVGGTNIKVGGSGHAVPLKIPSGVDFTASQMATAVKQRVDWPYDVVAIGYPGPVVSGRPLAEPKNLGGGWVRFNYAEAFGKPVKVINDAAMQALGSYEGGRMLFLGLGTGLGSALVADGVLEPLELAHLPYRKGRTFEDYVGLRGLQRLGRKKWQSHVGKVVALLRHALQVDYVVLGGGQTKKLKQVPPDVRLGGMLGGIRLWVPPQPGQGDPRRHLLPPA